MKNRPTNEVGRQEHFGAILPFTTSRIATRQPPSHDEICAAIFDGYCLVAQLAQERRSLHHAMIAGRLWSGFLDLFCD